MNYCGFNIEPFCSDVCGDHRRPQTLAEICRNMGICCGFRAVAAREKYPGFILLNIHDWLHRKLSKLKTSKIDERHFSVLVLSQGTVCSQISISTQFGIHNIKHPQNPVKHSGCLWVVGCGEVKSFTVSSFIVDSILHLFLSFSRIFNLSGFVLPIKIPPRCNLSICCHGNFLYSTWHNRA